MNLNEDLQIELKQLLAHLNAHYEDLLERAERPNFEKVYDDIFVHPETTYRFVAVLAWHEEEGVGKLHMRVDEEKTIIIDRGWVRCKSPLGANLVFSAESRSDAIRHAHALIATQKEKFLEMYSSANATQHGAAIPNPFPLHTAAHEELFLEKDLNPTPSPSPKHQGGEE